MFQNDQSSEFVEVINERPAAEQNFDKLAEAVETLKAIEYSEFKNENVLTKVSKAEHDSNDSKDKALQSNTSKRQKMSQKKNDFNFVLQDSFTEKISDEDFAKLPLSVRNEDIVGIKSKAKQIHMSDLKNKYNSKTVTMHKMYRNDEEKYNLHQEEKRNTHYFCFYDDTKIDHLLPDKLKDTTKKYHSIGKYLKVCFSWFRWLSFKNKI